MVTVDLAQPDLRHAFLGTLEIVADSCPRLVVPSGLLPINDQIALGYLQLGHRPLPLCQDDKRGWIPAVSWRAYQRRAPTTAEVVGWWMRYPNAGMGLVCGSDAGLIVLEAAP
jgi:hypothetical protein